MKTVISVAGDIDNEPLLGKPGLQIRGGLRFIFNHENTQKRLLLVLLGHKITF
jgi:hypothetical protein